MQSIFVHWIDDTTAEIVLAAVVLCWLGFALILVVGKKQAAKVEKKRIAISHLGFFVQGLGYGALFVFGRILFSSFLPMSKTAELIVAP